jgi:hypothetical protein
VPTTFIFKRGGKHYVFTQETFSLSQVTTDENHKDSYSRPTEKSAQAGTSGGDDAG